ncbi:MAG: glycine--tRNA ligase subunit beta [Firmicutes bacterium]|nr:glycine--tRNA ligase subunit beta [Bacillota bacterium]
MADLLVEIGTEELPAHDVAPLAEALQRALVQLLDARGVTHGPARWYATARRLATQVARVSEAEAQREEWIRGPSAQIAFDASGASTKAAIGFARSHHLSLEELTIREEAGGRYLYALQRSGGRATTALLAEQLSTLVAQLPLPRSMRWGAEEFRFLRPIRWVVALLGKEVIPLTLAGVSSDRKSYGHRTLAPHAFSLEDAADYERAMASHFVLADARQRQQRIEEQVRRMGEQAGGEAQIERPLLEEVTYLVEWPTAFVGRFDRDFLALPAEVLVASMRDHQRYFPIYGKEGLLPGFIGVRDGDEHALEQVIHGNERVLTARLADARFFWEEDRKWPLSHFLELLEGVLFQERLGNLAQKAERNAALVASIAAQVGLADEVRRQAVHAAEIGKFDLTTAMVREFTELQGVMGRIYALDYGEEAAVATAIDEQYAPRNAEAPLPQTLVGALLSIADKLDTLCSCFAVGIRPSGSADPYGLRRAALGALQVVRAFQLTVDLPQMLAEGVGLVTQQLGITARDDTQTALMAFCQQRFANLLLEEGFRRDAIEAVLTTPWRQVPEAERRVHVLHQWLLDKPQQVRAVAEMAVRCARLGGTQPPDSFQQEHLSEPAERVLYEALVQLGPQVDAALEQGRLDQAFALLQQLVDPVTRFFEEVLVMSPDPQQRALRLSLLRTVWQHAVRFCDWAKLVFTTE